LALFLFCVVISKKIEIFTVIYIVIGLSLFSLADSQLAPKFAFTGIVWLLVALSCDALIPNIQEKFLKHPYCVPASEMVYYGNFFGSLYLLVFLLTGGFYDEFLPALEFSIYVRPLFVPSVIIGNFLGFLGVNLIVNLINATDAVVAMMVTSVRKMLTLSLSFLVFFPRPFTIFHVIGAFMVFSGIFFHVTVRNTGHPPKIITRIAKKFGISL